MLLATLALELAALMAIIDSGRAGRPLDAPMAIRFAFARAAPVLAEKKLFLRSEERLVCVDFAQR